MSVIEGEALANKKFPGPQHKYNYNFLKVCRPKTPILVRMSKSTGRDIESKSLTKSKSRNVGPASYNTEIAFRKFSAKRSQNAIFPGTQPKPNGHQVPHCDKLKIKTQRFIDQVVKLKKGIPGVGNYKVEKSWDRQAGLPPSLKNKRH